MHYNISQTTLQSQTKTTWKKKLSIKIKIPQPVNLIIIIINKASEAQIDLRKLFEHIQNLKNEIEIKISNKNYVDAILTINKCLSISNKFYQEDHLFVIY